MLKAQGTLSMSSETNARTNVSSRLGPSARRLPGMVQAVIVACFVILSCGARLALAGPPFQTDDPEPVPYKHWEAYTFSTYDGTALGSATQGPAFEVNWGAVPDVQLHLVVPAAAALPPGGPDTFGLGDIELGIKYRFVHETAHRPEIGTFPFVEVPTGSPRAGLGNGRTWYRLPIWIQKSIGPWTTYGGGGEVLNSEPGTRNYPFGGWLLQRDLGKKLTLGGEIFAHGPEGVATLSNRSSTLADIGGYYYFRNPGFQLLFAVGHTIAGQPESIAYLGLYWTWGPASPHALLHDMTRF
jgi:hypothetical protein